MKRMEFSLRFDVSKTLSLLCNFSPMEWIGENAIHQSIDLKLNNLKQHTKSNEEKENKKNNDELQRTKQ